MIKKREKIIKDTEHGMIKKREEIARIKRCNDQERDNQIKVKEM